MTTDDVIKSIRQGLPLITGAFSKHQMTLNQGFSLGQLSMAMHMNIITSQNWADLNKEITQAAKDYEEMNK